MKLQYHTVIIAVILFCICKIEAAHLSKKYLPPNYAGQASRQPSNQYLAPGPSTQHYRPNQNHHQQHQQQYHQHQHQHQQQHPNLRYHGIQASSAGSAVNGHYGAFAAGSQFSNYGQHQARQSPQIPIVRNNFVNDANGNYNFDFETGNGIQRDEVGMHSGWPHGSQTVTGSYSYTGDDGKLYKVNYTADEDGFHAEGDHLPTAPAQHQQPQPHYHKSNQHIGSRRYGGASAYSENVAAATSVHAPSNKYLPPNRRH